jgi:hypothetical protein
MENKKSHVIVNTVASKIKPYRACSIISGGKIKWIGVSIIS